MKSENIQCDHCERVKLFNRRLYVLYCLTTQKLLTSASMKKREQEEIWQTLDTGNKIRKLLTHINVNASETETGYTALLLAVLNGKDKALQHPVVKRYNALSVLSDEDKAQ